MLLDRPYLLVKVQDHGHVRIRHPGAVVLRRWARVVCGSLGGGHRLGEFRTLALHDQVGGAVRVVQDASCQRCGLSVRIDTAPDTPRECMTGAACLEICAGPPGHADGTSSPAHGSG